MPYIIKPILLVAASIGAAFFLGHSLVQLPHESSVTPGQTAANPAHYRGASDAPVTLVEYGDYACPPCARYNPILNEVLQRYPDKVRREFRHYPLTGIHPNAFAAAIAAEAAGQQGRYWEMHDLLLSSQERWAHADNPQQEFAKLAASIGLDSDRFLEDMESPELRQRITEDIEMGQRIKIEATPTFLLDGRKIPQPPPTAEGFFALIDEQLQIGK